MFSYALLPLYEFIEFTNWRCDGAVFLDVGVFADDSFDS